MASDTPDPVAIPPSAVDLWRLACGDKLVMPEPIDQERFDRLAGHVAALVASVRAEERERADALLEMAWHAGARSATGATERMIRRRKNQAERIALGQGNPPGWMGVIFQCKEFLNALHSDKPPGHAIHPRAIRKIIRGTAIRQRGEADNAE